MSSSREATPASQEKNAAWVHQTPSPSPVFRHVVPPRIGDHGEQKSRHSQSSSSESAAGLESSELHEVLLQVCTPFIQQMLLALQKTLQEEIIARAEMYKRDDKSLQGEDESRPTFERRNTANSSADGSDGDPAFSYLFRKGASHDSGGTSTGRALASGIREPFVLPEGSDSEEAEQEQSPTSSQANPEPYAATPSLGSRTSSARLEEHAVAEYSRMKSNKVLRSDAVETSRSEGQSVDAGGGRGSDHKSTVVCRHWKRKGWCRYANSCNFLHPDDERGVGSRARSYTASSTKSSKTFRRTGRRQHVYSASSALAPGLVND